MWDEIVLISDHCLCIYLVLGRANRGLIGGFRSFPNYCIGISVSPHVCYILVFNL